MKKTNKKNMKEELEQELASDQEREDEELENVESEENMGDEDEDDEEEDDISAPIEMDLAPVEVPVKLKNLKGKVEQFVLKSAPGDDVWKHLTFMRSKTNFNAAGQPTGIKDFTGVFAGLISRCLYNKEGELVAKEVIEKWPPGVQTALYQRCQKLCGIDQYAVSRAKNG